MTRRHTLIKPGSSLGAVLLRLEELVVAGSGEDPFEEIFKLLLGRLRGGPLDRALGELEAGCPELFPGGARSRLLPSHLAACQEVLAGVALDDAALDAALEFLVTRAAKGEKGQFFTPRHVVDFAVRLATPRRGERMVDPACGSGAFVAAARAAGAEAWGFDFDARAARIAKALLLVRGGDPGRVARVNSLRRGELEAVRPGPYDLVLTNPPFAGELREPELLGAYRLAAGRTRVERDLLFLERCVELLAPGGRLAIVLPWNKLAAEAYADARRWLLEETRVRAVVALGRNTFRPHTGQQACLLLAERRRRGGAARGEEAIFFAISERAGKDARGEPVVVDGRIDHDLDEIRAAFAAARRRRRA